MSLRFRFNVPSLFSALDGVFFFAKRRHTRARGGEKYEQRSRELNKHLCALLPRARFSTSSALALFGSQLKLRCCWVCCSTVFSDSSRCLRYITPTYQWNIGSVSRVNPIEREHRRLCWFYFFLLNDTQRRNGILKLTIAQWKIDRDWAAAPLPLAWSSRHRHVYMQSVENTNILFISTCLLK